MAPRTRACDEQGSLQRGCMEAARPEEDGPGPRALLCPQLAASQGLRPVPTSSSGCRWPAEAAPPTRRRGWHGTALAVGACVVAGLGLVGLRRSCGDLGVPQAARLSWADGVIGVVEIDPEEIHGETPQQIASTCSNYPHLRFLSCRKNNLAGMGPDSGEEGLIFEGKNEWTNNKIEVAVNALSKYTPFSTTMNGMSGEYGSLNIQSGTAVQVKFSVRHADTKEPITEPYFALTFFDLDQGRHGESQESVTGSGFQNYALSTDIIQGAVSEVKVAHNQDGSRTFISSTFGNGRDNPKHPLKLNLQQKNRAVTLRFRNFKETVVTFAATAGPEPRFFTFVAYPALVCASQYASGFRPKLPNLHYGLPSESGVEGDDNDIFKQWFVKPGQHVDVNDALCSVSRMDGGGSIHVYRAPIEGFVKAIQSGLQDGDLLRKRLDDKTIAVIDDNQFAPLKAGPNDARTVSPALSTLKRWLVQPGDVVRRGDPIAEVTMKDGQVHKLLSAKDGLVNDTQKHLKPGDSCDQVSDRNLATISQFQPLPRGPTDAAVMAPPNSIFLRYLVEVGDDLETTTTVAEVKSASGEVEQVKTINSGMVKARQENLREGMILDDALAARDLLVLGEDRRFPPLEVHDLQAKVEAPHDSEFVKFHKAKGDLVREGDPLFDVKDRNGNLRTIRSREAGKVVARQGGLRPGDKIAEVMRDRNVMVIGRLPPLEVAPGEEPSNIHGNGATFDRFWVNVGDIVQEGQTVASVKEPDGTFREVKAPKYGTVKSRQEHLSQGAHVDRAMTDKDLVVIGKFPPVQAGGPRQHVVSAPEAAIFDKWYVEDGERVEVGQPLAQVTLPGRRLAEGVDAADSGNKIDIPAPVWGTVTDMQPLKSGEAISAQQAGPNICKLDQGPPWWLGLVFVLTTMCCCLGGIYAAMKKPTPYTPMDTPKEEPQAEGLRLDFQDGAKVRTVYAKRRPLGIKHNFVAPIIAHDFTINSYAKKKLKIRDGWKLRRIGDEELNDNPQFDEVNALLTKWLKEFEIWPLPIEFRPNHASSERRVVEFRERPIGVEFTNRAPIQVSKVHPDSPAAEAEVHAGWCVTRIGDADVHRNTNFHEVIGYFKEGVDALDDSGRKFHLPQ